MKITRSWREGKKTKNQPDKFTNAFINDIITILTKAKELGVDIIPLAKTNRAEDCVTDELLLFTPNGNDTFILLPNGAKGSYETEDEGSDAVVDAILTLALKHGVISNLTFDIDYEPAMTRELLKAIRLNIKKEP